MPQPLYSPDLAPADFFLYPKLKTPMKGKRFAMIEEIKEKSERLAVSDTKKRVSAVFRLLKKALALSCGGYFDGDKRDFDKYRHTF